MLGDLEYQFTVSCKQCYESTSVSGSDMTEAGGRLNQLGWRKRVYWMCPQCRRITGSAQSGGKDEQP